MNICPNCYKPILEAWPSLPGDYLVCRACGEFLTVNNNFAVEVAGPEQVIGATPLRLKVLLKQRCQVLKTKTERKNQ